MSVPDPPQADPIRLRRTVHLMEVAMSLYVDPLTALTLARQARTDRIQDVAEHERLRASLPRTKERPGGPRGEQSRLPRSRGWWKSWHAPWPARPAQRIAAKG